MFDPENEDSQFDLEFVPTTTLITELQRRHSDSLILLLKPEKVQHSVLDVLGAVSGDDDRVWATCDSLRANGFFRGE